MYTLLSSEAGLEHGVVEKQAEEGAGLKAPPQICLLDLGQAS